MSRNAGWRRRGSGAGLLFRARSCPGKSRRHGPRRTGGQANAWASEQIARRLPVDFADDATMRISHGLLHRLLVQGRGALRRELTACSRTGVRKLRMPRAHARARQDLHLSEIMISQRPAEAADRAVPGHWEGDLILAWSSAIGTLVERTMLHSAAIPAAWRAMATRLA